MSRYVKYIVQHKRNAPAADLAKKVADCIEYELKDKAGKFALEMWNAVTKDMDRKEVMKLGRKWGFIFRVERVMTCIIIDQKVAQ